MCEMCLILHGLVTTEHAIDSVTHLSGMPIQHDHLSKARGVWTTSHIICKEAHACQYIYVRDSGVLFILVDSRVDTKHIVFCILTTTVRTVVWGYWVHHVQIKSLTSHISSHINSHC